MTVNNSVSFVVAQGNGVATFFNYNFLIPDASEVAVFYTDTNNVTIQIPAGAYSITGIGNPAGGAVTYPLVGSPIAVGTTLAIVRSLQLVQLTTISNQGAFYPKVIEAALDYITMLIQQVNGRVAGIPIPPPQSVQIPWAIAGGTANVLTVTYSPPNTVLTNGLICSFRASFDNTTTTPTFNSDSLGANIITKHGGDALAAGDLQAAGEYFVRYNLPNTRWELYNPVDLPLGPPWATAGGTANVITANYAPANVALPDGLLLFFRAANNNTTATPTFAPDGLIAHTITKQGGVALAPLDITIGGEYLVRYNSGASRWELYNPNSIINNWAVAAGTANAITATYAPANLSLTDGLILGFRATNANTSSAPTFAPDGLTARTITKSGGVALFAGDISGNLAEVLVRYNLANTRWELLNPATNADPWAVAGGAADAITATYAPAIASLMDGMLLGFRAAAANITATPTFSPNGLTARTITKSGGLALSPGDIPGNLAEVLIRYNSGNTRWELCNPSINADPWAAAGGTANAITATYSPVEPALVDGLMLGFRATAANTTTNPTFSPNGLTARTITKLGGAALIAGDIPGNLAEMLVRYNLANTRWELLNPAPPATSSSGFFINVKAAPYNAVGNNIADDTAAIQAAITAAQGTTGNGIYLPPGAYKISSVLVISDVLEIKGAGKTTSSIHLASATQNGISITAAFSVYLHDFEIVGSQSAGSMIHINAAVTNNAFTIIDNMHFNGAFVGITSVDAADAIISNCLFINFNSIGISWGNTNSADEGDNMFFNNTFLNLVSGTKVGISIFCGSGFRIIGNKINLVQYGILVSTNTVGVPGAGSMSDFIIANNSIENFTAAGVAFTQTDSSACNNVQILGNQFEPLTNAIPILINAVHSTTWLTNLVIGNNLMCHTANSANASISLDGCKTSTVVGNVLSGGPGGFTVAVGLLIGADTTGGKSSLNQTNGVTTPFSNPSAVPWTNT